MTLTFIGTGSGKTSLKRNHSSLLLDDNSERCLIDCGDGISAALLDQGIDYNSITSVIITHFHPDHFSGILTLLVNMRLTERKTTINIHVHEKMTGFFNSLLLHAYLEGIKRKFPINIIGYRDNRRIELTAGCAILPRQNSHVLNKLGIENQDIFYSSSLMIEYSEGNILYTSDIGSAEDLLLFSDISIDYLITEAAHISVEEILTAVETGNIPNTYLTHIDDRDEKNIIKMTSQLPNITVAYDGLKISI